MAASSHAGVILAAPRSDGRLLVDTTTFADATGWELKPEGLCRDDICVPVRDRDRLVVDGQLDVAETAQALGRLSVVDASRGLAALGEPAAVVAEQMDSLQAPDVSLVDLSGEPVSLSDFGRRKRLLLAWSSW